MVEILGVTGALSGFVYLVWPQLTVPVSVMSLLAMLLAGAAWGAYSTVGRGSPTPLLDTKVHFYRAVLLASPTLLIIEWQHQWSLPAVVLAVTSGALTSTVGYAIWFKVLPHLRVSTAAVGQLSVPVIAAFGGIVFVNEPIETRFIIASTVILLSVFVVIKSRTNKNNTK